MIGAAHSPPVIVQLSPTRVEVFNIVTLGFRELVRLKAHVALENQNPPRWSFETHSLLPRFDPCTDTKCSARRLDYFACRKLVALALVDDVLRLFENAGVSQHCLWSWQLF